jgi:curved DNA-binding protein CbpA
MKTIEKELKKLNFPRILIDLHRNRKTGTLTIDTADVTKKVFIDRGNAVFASSTDEDDRLGEMLIKLGKITIEQYDRSVELLKQTGKRQGTILVELGYLTPKDLVMGVKSQVREIIYSLFQVEYAEYEFDEEQLPTREVITLQMSMGTLIYEGMKKINNVVRIKREMPDMNAVLKLNEDPKSVFRDIVLSPPDKAMLAMIDGTITVRELLDGTSVATFEAIKTMYVLYVTGMIEEQKNVVKPEEQIMVADEPPQPLDTEGESFDNRVNELYSNLYKLRPHDLIGIDETSDAKTVQNNYYKLVKKFHPDRSISSTDPLMLDKLITISEEIQNAYVLLKENDKRRAYFEAISINSQKADSKKFDEEHFRTELSRVNKELLFPRDASDKGKIKEEKNGESLNGISMDEPSQSADYTFKKQCEGVTVKGEEDVLSSHETVDEMESEKDKKGEYTYNTKSDESPGPLDDAVEEQSEGDAPKENEEILSARDESVGADIEMPRYDSDEQEQAPEVNPVNIIELEDTKPDDAKQESQAESMAEIEPKEEIQEKRRHRRFKLDSCEVSGEMFFAKEVTVLDMSMSGIALKVNKQLKIGKEYLINLHDDEKIIAIRALVVRSFLGESKTTADGDIAPVYLVGMEFTHVSDEQADDIARFIDNHKIDGRKNDETDGINDKRRDKRFQIDMPGKTILDFHELYRVKVISLSGMLIESSQPLEVEDTIQMHIVLPPNRTVPLLGRIVSCKRIGDDQERYDIAIEFIEMSEEYRERLQGFFQGIEVFQGTAAPPDKTDTLNREISDRTWTNLNESDMPLTHERYDRDPGADRESSSRDAINLQLLNLLEEIKLLLAQLRTELPGAAGHHIPATENLGEREETKEPPSVTSNETTVLQEDIPDHEHKVSREEYKNEPQAETIKKKKLKLWHVLIPVFFLIAAAVSFLFLYTPEKQKILSQPVQAKKESLPPAQKTQEALPPPAPEVKKVSPIAPTQAVQHTIELIAKDSTWLSATIDEKGSKEMILKPGEQIKWTAKNTISLIIGNAEGVKVIFDGKELGPLGGKGKVVKLKLPVHKNS